MDTFSDATLHVAQIIKYYEVRLSLNRSLGKYCPAMIFKESALGRFFHRVPMSVYVSDVCPLGVVWSWSTATRPSATRPSATRPSATRPSYYTRGALKTRGGCRASIADASIGHASILLQAWSPKNKGWAQSVHHPRVQRPCVNLIARVEPKK